MTCVIRHPNGYRANPTEELPPLLESSKGSIGVVYGEGGEVSEVREWTGRGWKLLTGVDKECAMDWMRI